MITVTADWLAAHLDDGHVRVADVRWYLSGKRGADEYARGHIPGAVFVDLDQDLASPRSPGRPGRHPFPSAADFAAALSRLGVERDTLVVAYDDSGGSTAARLWWLLRWFGHGGGRVLDGGIGAWVAAGRPLSTEVPALPPAAPLALSPGHARAVNRAEVDRLRALPGTVLLDARAAERFEGRVEPVDARPGHIPGARSAPFSGNLAAPGGALLPARELAARYQALGALRAETVVCYCGSGVTACHDLLALAIAGREDAALYEGSWSDWASDPSLPAATGLDGAPSPDRDA
jgi:thiosulfate/3-mercaptopyruvate sulfurtransferase